MNEAEWLACTDPQKMLHFLRADPADRKILLLVSACIRRHWDVFTDDGRAWVLLTEDYAELPGPHRLLHPDELGNDLDPAIFGDQWEDAMGIAGERGAWDGVGGAINQLFYAYYQCDDYDTLTGNREWEAERRQQVILLRDVFGNPFRSVSINPPSLAWNDRTIPRIAEAVYSDRQLPAGTLDNARLAILADALEEAGCTNADILNHCRQPGEHVRGCWVIDLILGRE